MDSKYDSLWLNSVISDVATDVTVEKDYIDTNYTHVNSLLSKLARYSSSSSSNSNNSSNSSFICNSKTLIDDRFKKAFYLFCYNNTHKHSKYKKNIRI